jgi:hypothetical protein
MKRVAVLEQLLERRAIASELPFEGQTQEWLSEAQRSGWLSVRGERQSRAEPGGLEYEPRLEVVADFTSCLSTLDDRGDGCASRKQNV